MLTIFFTLGVMGVVVCLSMTIYRGTQEKQEQTSLRISDRSIPVPAH